MPPIISIVGKSGSGKTTLIEKLIPFLKKRGYRIGVIKHASHGFDMDTPGKDSWRHKAAGADTVLVASRSKIAMFKDVESDSLDSFAEFFADVDLVITEGYKQEDKPKIEVFRPEAHRNPIGNSPLIALVTNASVDLGVPKFKLEDVALLAEFIIERFLKV